MFCLIWVVIFFNVKAMPAKANPVATQRAKIVEEFGRLDGEVEAFKPKLLRHEKLRSVILDWYPGLAGEEEATAPGLTCDVVISARDKIRSVTPAGKLKLFRLWGQKGFIARAVVLLKSLPDPKDDAGLYTVGALTGPRHLHVVPRDPAAATKKRAA